MATRRSIFSEMLGQICHPEIYSLHPDTFLEVTPRPFVLLSNLDICNSRATYHCSIILFVNSRSHLWNIAKHGARYKTNVPNTQGVFLQHTKTYYLRDPFSRGDFFRVLARLISYLSSGKSHVPYLWNRVDNPINSVLSFLM